MARPSSKTERREKRWGGGRYIEKKRKIERRSSVIGGRDREKGEATKREREREIERETHRETRDKHS